MSGPFLCSGCGRRLEVPEGHARRKLQCPSCGVYCEVPASARKTAPEAPAPKHLPRPTPPPPPVRQAQPEPVSSPTPPPVRAARPRRDVGFTCRECGEHVRLSAGRILPPECPHCGAPTAEPARGKSRPVAQPVAGPGQRAPAYVDDEDDGRPYIVVGRDEKKCPDCGLILQPDEVLCVRCGLNLQTGEKVAKTYDPVVRRWEAGMSYRRRMGIFLACQGVVLPLGIVGSLLRGDPTLFLGPWLLFTALLSFILGTFDRLDLTRDRRGRVELTKTWRVCFWQRPALEVRLARYEGVATGADHDVTGLDWFVMLCLLPFAFLPGLIWWLIVIRRDTFYVALTKDHGFPELMLYRGWNQELMHEIAETLHTVAELPYQGR